MRRTVLLLSVVAVLATSGVALAAGHEFEAELTTAAEVPPPTGSDGSGDATVTLNDDGSIDYEVTFTDLTGPPAAAHIHYGPPGEAGPVLLPLAHGPSPFSGTLTEADFAPVEGGPQSYEEALQAIRDGMTYINVHTEANPPGEIRGQLLALPPTDGPGTGSTLPLAGLLLLVAIVALTISLRRTTLRAG